MIFAILIYRNIEEICFLSLSLSLSLCEGDAQERKLRRQKVKRMAIERRRGASLRSLRWQTAVLWKFFAVENTPNALNNIPELAGAPGGAKTGGEPFASSRDNWWSFYSACTMHLITPPLPFGPLPFGQIAASLGFISTPEYLSSTPHPPLTRPVYSTLSRIHPVRPIIRRRLPGLYITVARLARSLRFPLWEIRAISISSVSSCRWIFSYVA